MFSSIISRPNRIPTELVASKPSILKTSTLLTMIKALFPASSLHRLGLSARWTRLQMILMARNVAIKPY